MADSNLFWNGTQSRTSLKRQSSLPGPVVKSLRPAPVPSLGIGAGGSIHKATATSQEKSPVVLSDRSQSLATQTTGSNYKITNYFSPLANVPNRNPKTQSIAKTIASNINPNPNSTSDQLDKLRRPVSELPSRFRPIFPFVSFNHVQSLVFDTVLESNKPIVVSAPTGSGKTGVFEMAIVKMLMDQDKRKVDLGAPKVIYLAPTKALCSERRDDWTKKFAPYSIQCIELTSDTNIAINFKNLQKSSILLATPEKWDSITRSWSGQKAFMQSIRLLLVDEIHLVNDGVRGATLEAVVSRMKTIRSIMWPSDPDNLRFVAVSATVSNINDIAQWFSSQNTPAQVCQVAPHERPVKLKTVVLGYAANMNGNEFMFDSQLNHKLSNVIREYSNDKPTLIFCATRKSAEKAAKVLAKEGNFDICYANERRRQYLEISGRIREKDLQETTRLGIGYHHAGLTAGDRRLIEQGFIDGKVMILCCTSTLALGVNLPAHLVIIKNTCFYDEGQFKPYSESSLVQMIGRAGRPQFDTEATAVILTKIQCRDEIEKMLTGKLIVDSNLHKFLTEHLNSEIVLGTINNDIIARKWIDSTFLHVRLLKNPENYGLKKDETSMNIENAIIRWCRNSLNKLLQHGMIKRTQQGQLEATESGCAMAKHYICLDTMVKLINLEGNETLWALLQLICSSQEVAGDIQLRNEDKPTLNTLVFPQNEDHKLRFPMDKVLTKEKKAAAILQATFGNVPIIETNAIQDSIRITRNATRVINCLRDISLMNNNISFQLLLNVLYLTQSFAAKLWENSIYVSKQLEKIGSTLSHNLAKNGLTSFEALRRANPRNIEVFCNRLSPFGTNVQQTCFGLPVYGIKIYFKDISNIDDRVQLMVEVTLVNGQDLRHKQSLPLRHSCVLIVGCQRTDKLLLRHQVIDGSLLARPDMTICFGTDVNKTDLVADEEVQGYILSESFVGLNASTSVKYVDPGVNSNYITIV